MIQGVARVQCKCPHEYQDKQYGTHVRVANTTAKQDKDFVEVRCSVCKAIHRVHPSKVK